ncbi:hypothetical protein HY029_02110 [Candidatus Gottesmanbacteria bacterium]|nr:hypothetical protein [Candidatus Gottesmanbacteria bacterium]
MSLLDKFLPKEKNKEYFLTVGVEENRITATVSLITDKEVTIIGTGISDFEETSEETEAADIAISAAEKKIGEDILVQKVIFGVPLSLIENERIKPAHLSKLKKITNTLSLTPCGFIEYPQALAYYLETKEESPPTLLLLSIGKTQVTFSHIRVGKIEKNVIVEKTSSFTADFGKALSEFSSSEILPSRIMLYNESGDSNLAETQEELLQFPWHKHSTFLHTPKIETLETQALTYALVEAAAKSLAKDLHLEEKEILTVKKKEEVEEVAEETFGFVKGKDITEELVVSTDDTQEEIKKTIEEEKVMQPESELIPDDKTQDEELSYSQKESILGKLPKINFPMPKFSIDKLPFITFCVAGILVISFLFFILWYFPNTTVNLIVYPVSSSSKVDVLFTTNADSIKSAKNTILATTTSEEVSGDKTANTTGKTQIGEKAKGAIILYNKTLNGKNFPKGSILSSSNLKFSLDDDVSIASASDTGEGLTFGKATANITAANIGPENNLASGTNFAFKDLDQSSYYGKNSDKLSGGTSRDVTSVSKDDQDKLLSNLTAELTAKAKQQMMQKLGSGENLLDVSLDTTPTSKKFNKNVSEEAKELSLSLTLKVSSLVYKEHDLTDLTRANTTSVPSGFTLASDKTRISVDEAKTNKNGDVLGKATISYFFFPNIETDKIKSQIAGKSFTQVDKYLSTVQNIGGVEIISDTKLPLFTNKIPFRRENIYITVVSR